MGYLHNSQLPILKHLNPMYFNTYPHQLGTGIQTHCSCDTKNIASTCAKKTRLDLDNNYELRQCILVSFLTFKVDLSQFKLLSLHQA